MTTLLIPLLFVFDSELVQTFRKRMTDYLYTVLLFTVWMTVYGWVAMFWIEVFREPVVTLPWPTWVQGIFFIAVGDFVYYWWHRLLHNGLWTVHAVHHSGEVFHALLNNRVHPIEQMTNFSLKMVVPLIFGGSDFAWLGLVLYAQGYVNHWETSFTFWPINYVLVTPCTHRVHHSSERRHFDKNFGGLTLLWDWVFGTVYIPGRERPEVGCGDYKNSGPIRTWTSHMLLRSNS